MKKIKSFTPLKKKTYQFGIIAEFIAIIFLLFKGYKIIARRYRNYSGEVDIIALKKNLLIGIEVKARKKINLIEEVLSNSQEWRIKNSLEIFWSKNKKYQNCGMRFDLIVIMPWQMPKHLIDYF